MKIVLIPTINIYESAMTSGKDVAVCKFIVHACKQLTHPILICVNDNNCYY